MLNNGKFFILGVGAQKAGTTWLANQLEKPSFLATEESKNSMFSTNYSPKTRQPTTNLNALNKPISIDTSSTDSSKTRIFLSVKKC